MSKKYDIQEVFNLLGEDVLNATEPVIKSDSIKVDGYLVYKDSWRYRTFYQKGLKCACCGREGSYFKLKADSNIPTPKTSSDSIFFSKKSKISSFFFPINL